MSGIVGVFRRDDAPVNGPLLAALTNFQAFRGPDAQTVWNDGVIGFGHTMLRTTREAANESQPTSLDNRYWITADVRLDSRQDLIEKLRDKNDEVDRHSVTDPELILRAYRAWGESCVDYLRGDFAFAIWDAAHKKLFCARDHFGIKSFFYAVNEKQFLFSNTLNCLRAHSDVSDELNDAAIGDFLLFGLNCEIATTTFRDIQRLPPAHCLIVSATQFRVRRFWSIPTDGRIRYQCPQEYIQNFLEILRAAVADRLRTDHMGIFLSGGLDSGVVAETAAELAKTADGATELRSYTRGFRSLIPDDEGAYARLTADFLKIPNFFRPLDNLLLFEQWDDPQILPPEPAETPFFGSPIDNYSEFGPAFRVFLTGDGGDNLTRFQMLPYAMDLLRRRERKHFLREIMIFLWLRPFPWRGIAHRLYGLAPGGGMADVFSWMSQDFRKCVDSQTRGRSEPSRGSPVYPILPSAYESLTAPYWGLFFEADDPGVSRIPLEFRYPFLDLRMVEYLLSIPTFPWLFDKSILRRSMEGKLPNEIRMRPKTPIQGDLLGCILARSPGFDAKSVEPTSQMNRYVEWTKVPELSVRTPSSKRRMVTRTFALNFWLQGAIPFRYKLKVGSNGDGTGQA